MRYQHLKTARKITKYIGLVVPLVIVLLLVGFNPRVPSFFVSTSHAIATPFVSLGNFFDARVSNITTYFKNKQNLQNENDALKSNLAELQRKVFITNTLQSENDRLLTMLGYTNEDTGFLLASVITDVAIITNDLFLINIGVENGVREGMLVISPEHIAIGYVTHALDGTAIVKKFSAPDVKFSAVINATTSVQTTFSGQGSGSMTISLPRDVSVEEYDSVMLPSLSVRPLGEIVSIEVTPEDAFKTLYLRSPVNIHNVRHVFVDTTVTWNANDISRTIDFTFNTQEQDEGE